MKNKFRGKRIDNGEWVYGYFFKSWEQAYILWGTTNGIPNMTEVDPKTVGQLTGEEDKNGNEIYEDDITDSLYADRGCIGMYHIVWRDGGFFPLRLRLEEHQQQNVNITMSCLERCKIIGNKFDDSNLLSE